MNAAKGDSENTNRKLAKSLKCFLWSWSKMLSPHYTCVQFTMLDALTNLGQDSKQSHGKPTWIKYILKKERPSPGFSENTPLQLECSTSHVITNVLYVAEMMHRRYQLLLFRNDWYPFAHPPTAGGKIKSTANVSIGSQSLMVRQMAVLSEPVDASSYRDLKLSCSVWHKLQLWSVLHLQEGD